MNTNHHGTLPPPFLLIKSQNIMFGWVYLLLVAGVEASNRKILVDMMKINWRTLIKTP